MRATFLTAIMLTFPVLTLRGEEPAASDENTPAKVLESIPPLSDAEQKVVEEALIKLRSTDRDIRNIGVETICSMGPRAIKSVEEYKKGTNNTDEILSMVVDQVLERLHLNSTPQRTWENLLKALESGNHSTVRACCTIEEYAMRIIGSGPGQGTFPVSLDSIGKFWNDIKVSWPYSSVTESGLKVPLLLARNENNEQRFLTFKRVEGRWLFAGVVPEPISNLSPVRKIGEKEK